MEINEDISKMDHSSWIKEVEILHLTGWIKEEQQHEIDELTKVLFELMRGLGKINSNLLKDHIGLNTQACKNLLQLIERNHSDIISKEKTNGIINYFFKDKKFEFNFQDNIRNVINPRIKSYSVLLNPLLFINRRLRSYHLKSKSIKPNLNEISSSLVELNRIIINENDKEALNIPHEIKELTLDKIYIRGLEKGELHKQETSFILMFNDHECGRITSQHYSYELLCDELAHISNNNDLIISTINLWLKNEAPDIIFEIYLVDTYKKIVIRTEESQVINFGFLYKFYQKNNNVTKSFQIQNGWILQVTIEIVINNSQMKQLFDYFTQLSLDLRKDYSRIFVQDNNEFKRRILESWKTETKMTKKSLIEQLVYLTKSHTDEWLFHILARLQEGLIFE